MDTLIICLLFVSVSVAPLTVLFGGWIMRSTASAEPNRFVGYRSQISMSSTEAWQYANDYCGRLWMRLGLFMLAGSMAVLLIAVMVILASGSSVQSTATILSWVVIGAAAAQVVCLVLSFFRVERHLRTVFRADGTRREQTGA